MVESKSEMREIIESLAVAVLIVTFVTVFIGRFCRVKGQSMEPTLHTAEWLWTDRLTYEFGAPQRGDVIVLKYRDTREKYVKRVIGLPGENVEVKEHKVYVNGQALLEPYIKEAPANDYAKVTVPGDSYFVMGDNRNQSDDSRGSVSYVPRASIEGKAIVRLWPVWLLRVFMRPKIEMEYDYKAPAYNTPQYDGSVSPEISRPEIKINQ